MSVPLDKPSSFAVLAKKLASDIAPALLEKRE
jgi:hypothetical protein